LASVTQHEKHRFLVDQSEPRSDALRRELEILEPRCQRTFTPSGAVIARSSGSYHFTPEGRKLADFTSGVLVANLGHHPTRWWDRVNGYMGLRFEPTEHRYRTAAPLTAYNAISAVEVEASRRLLASLQSQHGGARMNQLLWAASGSEAVQKALKAALMRRPGADLILATRNGFHGKKGLAAAVTGTEADDDRDPRVKFISFPMEECRSVDRRREPIDLTPYQEELKRAHATHGDRISALITEPYLGGGGSYHPQVEYLQLLQQFCREHDVLFILDEVQSNFGRTGAMYAYTTYGVEPDLVVLGKGMGNGIPVDAVAGRRDVLEKLRYGDASDTWSAHPLGCAAVLATLDEFETGDVLEHALQLAIVMEAGLARLMKLKAVRAVRGEGTVWGVHCAATTQRSPEQVAAEIVRRCYLGDKQGRAIHLLGPLAGCVIRVAPPLPMELEEALEYLDAMHDIVAGIG
jgi:4-aminobutyrate aminotransferase-like enzyme